jgi:transcription antitermination factor NusG
MKRTWYVLHVKPRTEKKAVAYLNRYGCFSHLPLYTKIYRKQRRKVRVELPLFPGYVFTRLSPDERLSMLKTNLIVDMILLERPRATIHQLRQINRASRSASELRKMSGTFKAGDYVRVTSGLLRGTEGYVKYDGEKATLCLNVEILGTCVEVSVSPDCVEKVA